jgi:hypothetical protein
VSQEVLTPFEILGYTLGSGGLMIFEALDLLDDLRTDLEKISLPQTEALVARLAPDDPLKASCAHAASKGGVCGGLSGLFSRKILSQCIFTSV